MPAYLGWARPLACRRPGVVLGTGDVALWRRSGGGAVLFDAPQIPAGMHPFRWIPLDSTGIRLIPVEWNQNPVE